MESILHAEFFRWKLLFRIYKAKQIPKMKQIPKTTLQYGGKTLQEHDERLRKVFLKIKESGLKLGKTKC